VNSQTDAVPGPREVFARFAEEVLSHAPSLTPGLWADDVVVETPFAEPGQPRRFHGFEQFRQVAEAGRAALPVRFDEFRNVVIHETGDPDVIVAEYEIVGTSTVSGKQSAAPFVLVLTARHGQIHHFREYQSLAALASAFG
jgi:ketosteroid isomerase-like protein